MGLVLVRGKALGVGVLPAVRGGGRQVRGRHVQLGGAKRVNTSATPRFLSQMTSSDVATYLPRHQRRLRLLVS